MHAALRSACITYHSVKIYSHNYFQFYNNWWLGSRNCI